MNSLQLDRASQTLLRDLRFAHAAAQARGQRYSVLFTARGYSIQRASATLSEVSFPPGVEVEGIVTTRVIWFSSQGSSSGGFVSLRKSTGVKTILVPAARGRAYVVPGDAR